MNKLIKVTALRCFIFFNITAPIWTYSEHTVDIEKAFCIIKQFSFFFGQLQALRV